MVVVGVCLVPSWPGVLNLDLPGLPDNITQLHVAAKYIGDYVADLKPDLIGNKYRDHLRDSIISCCCLNVKSVGISSRSCSQ